MSEPQIDEAEAIERLTVTITEAPDDQTLTFSLGPQASLQSDNELVEQYHNFLGDQRLSWTTHHRLTRLLGAGGQGKVYLSERRGADDFTVPIAVKVFSPEQFANESGYVETMKRHASVAMQIAQIQHDNLLDVHNFVDRNRIRMLVIEWIDGLDLLMLLSKERMLRLQNQVSEKRWNRINDHILTTTKNQPRFRSGAAVAIIRECLSALEALHRHGIVHGDIKPGNIMIKRSGASKIIDIGSAFSIDSPPPHRTCTPAYAAPEVLKGEIACPLSDQASLGYVLIELISGKNPFAGKRTYDEMVKAKHELPDQLEEILPPKLGNKEFLINFCRKLIAVDPADRFPNAAEAHINQQGAADYHRQLIMNAGNENIEFEHEIGLWLEEVIQGDEQAL
ncbi:MAG: serine/threonine protein kinase [Pirellulales bacterium]|nr:serine/threonine protein kinase [Pirellulales bacterium]